MNPALSQALAELEWASIEGKITLLIWILSNIASQLIWTFERDAKVHEAELARLEALLGEIKTATLEYGAFFTANETEINWITAIRSKINSVHPQLRGSYRTIQLCDKSLEIVRSNANILHTNSNFFGQLAIIEGLFGALALEINDKETTSSSRVDRLKRDLTNLNRSIWSINTAMSSFPDSIEGIAAEIRTLSESIENRYNWNTWDSSGDKLSQLLGINLPKSQGNHFIFMNNPLLSELLSEIFEQIPDNESYSSSFISDIERISQSESYSLIKQEKVAAPELIDSFWNIFRLYQKLIDIYKKVFDTVDKIHAKDTNRRERFLFPKEKDQESGLETHSAYQWKEIEFFEKVNKIARWIWAATLSPLKRSHVWDERLVNAKKQIFTVLYSVLESLQNDPEYPKSEEFKKKLSFLIAKKVKYNRLRQEIAQEGRKGVWEERDTNHYCISVNDHWEVDGLIKKAIAKPARVIWNIFEEIKASIAELRDNSESYSHLTNAFPWAANSLDGNMIVIGPYWVWKSQLMRELASDPTIVTIEIKFSDISSFWYGVTDKNMKLFYELARKKHRETGKQVFILFDEFDGIFSIWNSMSWGQQNNVQKELQMWLDGIDGNEWTHLIGFSNVPQGIPIDIFRRSKTLVIPEAKPQEKSELIQSRLERFPLSDDLNEFLWKIKWELDYDEIQRRIGDDQSEKDLTRLKERSYLLEYHLKSLWVNPDERKMFYHIFVATPKIVVSICEAAFKIYVSKLKAKDPHWVKRLDTRLWRLDKRKKKNDKDYLALFSEFWVEITLDDFQKAINQVFKSASVEQEIKLNARFYDYVDELFAHINWAAFKV